MKCKLLLIFAALLMSVGLACAQSRSASGTVISAEDNEPLVGATVRVPGTNLAVSTDVDGKFLIPNIPASAKNVEVSYVGMITKQDPIAQGLVITLSSSDQTLDEVVVTAYGTSKKSSLTGAITAVKNDKIELRPTSSAVSALEGNVSGLPASGHRERPAR